MDLDGRPYRAFIAIAEERSFSRAAERLNTSQPALSAQIREFERLLGFALFQRTSRTVELTAQGRQFLGNARRIVSETELAKQAARAIETNQLTVAMSMRSLLIPERVALVERFIAARPDIPLRITNDSEARHLAAVARREVDIALLIEPMLAGQVIYSPLDPGSGAAGDLERLILTQQPIRILLPKEHPLSRRSVLTTEALKGLKITTFDRTHGIALTDAIGSFLTRAGVELVRAPERSAMAIERYAAVRRIAAVSLGWFGTSHLDGTRPMVARPIEELNAGSCLSLVRAKGEERPGAAAFWSLALAG